MAGSPVRAESRNGEERGTSPSIEETVSSPLLSLVPVEDGVMLTGVRLAGISHESGVFESLSVLKHEDWQRIFPVSVVGEGDSSDALPAIAGRYRIVEGAVEFQPLFGFEAGIGFSARFEPSRLMRRLRLRGVTELELVGEAVSLSFGSERERKEVRTVVKRVYPSADALPENLLKFYLHFSAPMTLGRSYRHIHLFREDGSEVQAPFLQLDEELWDPAGQRMTVLIDPGRIKSGLLPRDEIGPSLREGDRFRLVVDAGWKDSDGVPLAAAFEKRFRVKEPDTKQPRMAAWTLSLPSVGSREPLTVSFEEPLDHALLSRLLWVANSDGIEVDGRGTIDRDETRWQWIPVEPWQKGHYSLNVENTLEDLAGNSLGRLFEVDSFLRVTQRVARETFRRPFQLKP